MIDPARFSLTEHKNQDWTLTAEEGTTIETVLKPEFFANIAVNLRPYDKIHVRVDTGDWYAELLVLQAERNWARVCVLRYLDFTEETERSSEPVTADSPLMDYKIQFRGPHLKYSVIRKSDNEVLKEKCENKGEAQFWLDNYLKSTLL